MHIIVTPIPGAGLFLGETKNTAARVRVLMLKLAEEGFGELFKRGRSIVFRKAAIDEMPENLQKLLKKASCRGQ